jgi:ornithine cyclodeaminase/alanine dehydrogenase-like protein (mu-crystallin family)
MAPGGGMFLVFDAADGQIKGIMQENRYLTDVRTGAAGGVAIKHLSRPTDKRVGFIGTGAVSKSLARAIAEVRPGFTASAYAFEYCEDFCDEMSAELGTTFAVCETPQEVCAASDIIVTCTPGGATVLEKSWLKPGTTIVAIGSDQPTKQEIPVDVLASSKYICDLISQTSQIGELRSAIDAGVMSEGDVHAELGEVVNGKQASKQRTLPPVCLALH